MACSKITFDTLAEAKRYIHDKAKAGRNGFNGRAYRCPRCDEWHLTTMSKAESRRKSKAYKLKVKGE